MEENVELTDKGDRMIEFIETVTGVALEPWQKFVVHRMVEAEEAGMRLTMELPARGRMRLSH